MITVTRREIPGLIPHIGRLINNERDLNKKRALMKIMMTLVESVRRAEDYEFSLDEIALIHSALESYFQMDIKTLIKLR